ncbi:hypothetical protein BU25DRAFT_474904 [Macroventuria anomochaeta]|uniref:Uncharacterized protein n=1 Tax=Macroventuria anomochaeta TaxID=301207 RepID=A0ACB6SF28_9PLEO|nr:uncharacterized protein BU25DRAFT_474904 [Macroventuria anomochaeta]KAF2631869.1 hypothetical protein BU25DRAFT_474904 [Macroventuria anomochaeta]
MTLAAFACMLCRMLSIFLVYSFPFRLAFDHIEQAYNICRSAVPSYIRRRLRRLAPQLEPPRQLSALTVFVVFRLICSVCSFQCSFASIVSPRYLHVALGCILAHLVRMEVSVLMRLCDLVKYVSWNLLGAKTDACLLAHCSLKDLAQRVARLLCCLAPCQNAAIVYVTCGYGIWRMVAFIYQIGSVEEVEDRQ